MHFIKQFIKFGEKQVMCCIFPASIFLTLALSKVIKIPFLYRYDFILIICVATQIFMVLSKLETVDELKVICMFHIIGLFLELFKTHAGSWSYPEPGYVKLGGVPLYSGFMYASVASYICQAWKRFDLRFLHWPKNYTTYPLAGIIYLNFFTHHYIPDFRWVIIASLFIIFKASKVTFNVEGHRYTMSTILSYLLIGFFIWIAENISTFFGAWKYPNQRDIWHMVDLGKISSWFLLVIISVIIVANLKHIKYGSTEVTEEDVLSLNDIKAL